MDERLGSVVKHQFIETFDGMRADVGRKLRLETAVPGAEFESKKPEIFVTKR